MAAEEPDVYAAQNAEWRLLGPGPHAVLQGGLCGSEFHLRAVSFFFPKALTRNRRAEVPRAPARPGRPSVPLLDGESPQGTVQQRQEGDGAVPPGASSDPGQGQL